MSEREAGGKSSRTCLGHWVLPAGRISPCWLEAEKGLRGQRAASRASSLFSADNRREILMLREFALQPEDGKLLACLMLAQVASRFLELSSQPTR